MVDEALVDIIIQKAATLVAVPESADEAALTLDVQSWNAVVSEKCARFVCEANKQRIVCLKMLMAELNQDVPHMNGPGGDEV